jgi:serine/threonine protein kinase
MEYIEGETLKARLSRGGRLSPGQVIEIGLQVATVLEYLHVYAPGAPIYYRDIKPANIMITPSGRVYLIDFGAACFFDPLLAASDTAICTIGYAAPQQCLGQVSHSDDIYSLGATLHHLLTAQKPTGGNPFSFPALGWQGIPRLADLEQLVLQMVHLDEGGRPASMTEVKGRLQYYARVNSALRVPKTWRQAAVPVSVVSWDGDAGTGSSCGQRSTSWSQRPEAAQRVGCPFPRLSDIAMGMGLLLGGFLILFCGVVAGALLAAVTR